jgi:signal transduction histidine kinase
MGQYCPAMVKIRLRTKFLFSLIFTTAALTGTSLLIVKSYAGKHARQDIYEQVENSLVTFQQFAQQRQRMLAQSAEIAASQPNIKALMTTQHGPTIQDASSDFSEVGGADLFLLANATGKVMALHTATDFSREMAQTSLSATLGRRQSRDWWFGRGHLFEVYLQPIYFGSPENQVLLGVLATGFEVDHRLARGTARVASSHVAFRYGTAIITSTLAPEQQNELATHDVLAGVRAPALQQVRLGAESFVGTTVELAPSGTEAVTVTVLKSSDASTLFLRNMNRLLLVVGLIAVVSGGCLIFVISDTFTRPLAKLVSGVHALEKGDFGYPLNVRSRDELGEVTSAFERMRRTLQESQQNLLHAERLATIGRMASSISHDLRHPLTTVLAYAEILSEGDIDEGQRKDVYREIRMSVNKMTELISSLLEFSKTQEALHLVHGDLIETFKHTIGTFRLHPEFRHVQITVIHEGSTEGWFDFKKLDRAFRNILQNAAEAAPPDSARIQVRVMRVNDHVEISIADNGPGIAEEIRGEIFQPFVTRDKVGGTGLGLAVVHKIVQDHKGDVKIESSGPRGTTFKIILPVTPVATPCVSNVPSHVIARG